MYGDSSTAWSASSGGRSTDSATTSGRGTITSRDLLVGEVEDLVEHLLLARLDLPALGRLADEHLQLGLGVDAPSAPGSSQPEQPQHELASIAAAARSAAASTTKKPRTGVGDGERRPFRVAERDRLRHELADHDVEEREDQVREDHRDDGREHGSKTRASACSPSAPIASDVSVTPSCIAAMKRGGESVIVQHLPRAPVCPCCGELLHARPPHGDEAVLGGDEVAVQRISTATAMSSKRSVMPRSPGRGD